MREDDPDNPLGDLAGADLGDEWLESLKSELEPQVAAPARAVVAPQAIAPAPGWAAENTAERVAARNQGEVELLEWRVKDLEQKLASLYEELERKNRDIEELIQRNAAVTRNLDEIQENQGEVDLLRQRIMERENAFGRLEDELKAAVEKHQHQAVQLEEAQVLLAEKAQQNAELLESHQLLQAQLEEAWEKGDQVKVLEGSLAEAQEAARGLDMRAVAAEQSKADLQDDLNAARTEAAELLARIQELESAVGRIRSLEDELASTREQVTFQELTIRNLAEERTGLQADANARMTP